MVVRLVYGHQTSDSFSFKFVLFTSFKYVLFTGKSVKKREQHQQQSLNVCSLRQRQQRNLSMLRTSFTVLCTRFSENEARNTFTFSLFLLRRKSFRVLREADGRSLLGLLLTGRTIKPEARKIVPVSNYLTKALKSLIDCYCFNFL